MGYHQVNAAPTRKVFAGGVAAASTTILVFVLNTFVMPETRPITAEVAAAFTAVLGLIASYLVPPDKGDQVQETVPQQ
jgi:hypothetical protein